MVREVGRLTSHETTNGKLKYKYPRYQNVVVYIGVSKNSGTPKWMVYNGKTLLKWVIWGENPPF